MYDCRVLSLVAAFFFQAEDGIRDLVRSRGLGDVYKRQVLTELPNRALCTERLRQAVQQAALSGERLAVLFLSLIHI